MTTQTATTPEVTTNDNGHAPLIDSTNVAAIALLDSWDNARDVDQASGETGAPIEEGKVQNRVNFRTGLVEP